MTHIRRARLSDTPFIAATYRTFVESHWASFEQVAPTANEIAARIDAAGDRYPWLVAEQDQPLAYAYASPHRTRAAYVSSVDTTIYCAEDARGKGIGRALYNALIAPLSKPGYVTAFAGIALPNPASISLHKAVGFALIGTYPKVGYKHGAWRDTQWWGRALSDPRDPPAPILPVSQVFAGI